MQDIFDDLGAKTEIPKFTNEDFVKNSKDILSTIDKSFHESWYNRWLEQDEYDDKRCEGCKGSGCFKINEKEINCEADKENGECFERCFDHESFSETMQEIIFGDKPFFDLIACEIIDK